MDFTSLFTDTLLFDYCMNDSLASPGTKRLDQKSLWMFGEFYIIIFISTINELNIYYKHKLMHSCFGMQKTIRKRLLL